MRLSTNCESFFLVASIESSIVALNCNCTSFPGAGTEIY